MNGKFYHTVNCNGMQFNSYHNIGQKIFTVEFLTPQPFEFWASFSDSLKRIGGEPQKTLKLGISNLCIIKNYFRNHPQYMLCLWWIDERWNSNCK